MTPAELLFSLGMSCIGLAVVLLGICLIVGQWD